MVKKSRSKKSLRHGKTSTSTTDAAQPVVDAAEAGPSGTSPLEVGSGSPPLRSPTTLEQPQHDASGSSYVEVAHNLGLSGQEAIDFVAHNSGVDRLKTPPPTQPSNTTPVGPSFTQPLQAPADPAAPERIFQPPKHPNGGIGSSPLKPGPDGWLLTDHTLDSVRPYVIRDLADARPTTVEVWLSTYLGMKSDTFQSWSTEIGKAGWFHDEDVQNALRMYCSTNVEKARYEPLIGLLNRLVCLGRGLLPLAGRRKKQYPIDNLVFVNNASQAIDTIPEHEKLGAIRRPDIILVRKTADPAVSGHKAKWTDLLSWCEVKVIKDLYSTLDCAMKARGLSGLPVLMPSTETDTNKGESSKRKATARKASSNKLRKPDSEVSTPSVSSKGTKRERESDDVLERVRAQLRKGIFQFDSSKSVNAELRPSQAAVQSGCYALEDLSCSYGTKLSCFGITILDDRLHLWHYDACGVVYTDQKLSFIDDFEDAAAAVIAIANCTTVQFGYLPTDVMKPPHPYPANFPPANLLNNTFEVHAADRKKKLHVRLRTPINTQYTITGRRSFVYNARIHPRPEGYNKEGVIIKFSYQATTRSAENTLVDLARRCEVVDHLPDIHGWDDTWVLTDSAREVAKSDKRYSSAPTSPTTREGEIDSPEFQDRVLRAIVYTAYGSIRDLFIEHIELLPIMVDQMIDCLHDLRYKAKILHRDISVNNIMYKVRDGKYVFILIDFDMAVLLEDDDGHSTYTASSRHRTGTLPFMAYELILDAWNGAQNPDTWKPIRHVLRHDFESLFYVSYWIVTALDLHGAHDPDQDLLAQFARALEIGGLRELANNKKVTLTTPLNNACLTLPKSSAFLEGWFNNFQRLFRKAVTAKDDHGAEVSDAANGFIDNAAPFDEETWNGMITRDTLQAALRPRIPQKSRDMADKGHEFEPRINLDTDEMFAEGREGIPVDDGASLVPVVTGPVTRAAARAAIASAAAVAAAKTTAKTRKPRKQTSKKQIKKPAVVKKKESTVKRVLKAAAGGVRRVLRPRDKLKKPEW